MEFYNKMVENRKMLEMKKTNSLFSIKYSRTMTHSSYLFGFMIFVVSSFHFLPSISVIHTWEYVMFLGLLFVLIVTSITLSSRSMDESFLHDQSDSYKDTILEKYLEIYGSKYDVILSRYFLIENLYTIRISNFCSISHLVGSILLLFDRSSAEKFYMLAFLSIIIFIIHLSKIIMSSLLLNGSIQIKRIIVSNLYKTNEDFIATCVDVLTCMASVCFVLGFSSLDSVLLEQRVVIDFDNTYNNYNSAGWFQASGGFYLLSVMFVIIEYCADFRV